MSCKVQTITCASTLFRSKAQFKHSFPMMFRDAGAIICHGYHGTNLDVVLLIAAWNLSLIQCDSHVAGVCLQGVDDQARQSPKRCEGRMYRFTGRLM